MCNMSALSCKLLILLCTTTCFLTLCESVSPDVELYSELKTITFDINRNAIRTRLPSSPQVVCKSDNLKWCSDSLLDKVVCKHTGELGSDKEWTCATRLAESYYMIKSDVECETRPEAGNGYITRDSCVVYATIQGSDLSPQALIAIVLIFIVLVMICLTISAWNGDFRGSGGSNDNCCLLYLLLASMKGGVRMVTSVSSGSGSLA